MRNFKTIFAAAIAAMSLTGVAVYAQSNGPNPQSGGGVAPMFPGGSVWGAAQLYAAINPNGSTLRGAGNSSSTRLAPGVYEVRFRRNITECAWSGTIGFGGFSGITGPSHISVTGRFGTTTGVFVQTWDAVGTPTDLPFLLTVICG
jgi:hypothetical protein